RASSAACRSWSLDQSEFPLGLPLHAHRVVSATSVRSEPLALDSVVDQDRENELVQQPSADRRPCVLNTLAQPRQ
ncbi:MAG: hypothetical protein VX526_02745, partial [Actinomycetota bacterium]|nr:hypothetical protein [Actinomycetota bacterium]